MSTDNTSRTRNGHSARLPQSLSAWRPAQWSLRWYDDDDQAAQLAKLTTREARKAPGAPARWSRFLAARARWILAVTLVAVAAAAALTLAQAPVYRSTAVVVVEPAATAADNSVGPNMATEEAVVTSYAVLSKAARVLDVTVPSLQQGVSVSAPGTTSLLHITFSGPHPGGAQERAQAIAKAYVSYRTPTTAARSTTTAPTASLVTPATLPLPVQSGLCDQPWRGTDRGTCPGHRQRSAPRLPR